MAIALHIKVLVKLKSGMHLNNTGQYYKAYYDYALKILQCHLHTDWLILIHLHSHQDLDVQYEQEWSFYD